MLFWGYFCCVNVAACPILNKWTTAKMSTLQLRTSGAVQIPLAELPSGVFVVYKDLNDVLVLPVDETSFYDCGVTTKDLISCARADSPDVCIVHHGNSTGTAPCTEGALKDTQGGAEEEGHPCEKIEDTVTQWKVIPHPSHRMMTRPRATIFNGSVYRSPMEAYALSLVLKAIGAKQLHAASVQHAFELLPTQFKDLSPLLAAAGQLGHHQRESRYGLQYREQPPNLGVLQMVHRWLGSGDSREASGGVFVFMYGSVIRRPCPCGSGGLKVSIYTPNGPVADNGYLSTDWIFGNQHDSDIPRLCRFGDVDGVVSLNCFPRDTHILGRMSARRTADACVLLVGVASAFIECDVAREYDHLIRQSLPPTNVASMSQHNVQDS